jgi:integrase
MAKRVNGEGTIMYLEKKKLWMGKISLGRKSDGTINRQSIYGKTQKEVSDKLRNLSIQYGTGDVFDAASMTFKEWVNYWLENYKKLNLKPKTYEVYDRFIKLHIATSSIGQTTLRKITPMQIQRLVNDKFKSGLSSSSVRKMFNIINQALQKACDSDMLQKNPASTVELPEHSQKEIKVFTMEEQNKFFEAAKDDALYDFFVIAVDTGIRLGELLAITWKDVDLKNELISISKNLIYVKDYNNEGDKENILKIQEVPKTKASIRKVPLTQRSKHILKKRKLAAEDDEGTIFITKTKKFISPRNVERSFCRIAEKAKISDCNVHSLRHTYATRMFEAGTPAKIVSEILGHSKVSHTLDIYTHVIPHLKNEAVKNLDLLYKNLNATAK